MARAPMILLVAVGLLACLAHASAQIQTIMAFCGVAFGAAGTFPGGVASPACAFGGQAVIADPAAFAAGGIPVDGFFFAATNAAGAAGVGDPALDDAAITIRVPLPFQLLNGLVTSFRYPAIVIFEAVPAGGGTLTVQAQYTLSNARLTAITHSATTGQATPVYALTVNSQQLTYNQPGAGSLCFQFDTNTACTPVLTV